MNAPQLIAWERLIGQYRCKWMPAVNFLREVNKSVNALGGNYFIFVCLFHAYVKLYVNLEK